MSSVETVTLSITDLVGSTGRASRVGPAVADQLRGEHFGLIREVREVTEGHCEGRATARALDLAHAQRGIEPCAAAILETGARATD